MKRKIDVEKIVNTQVTSVVFTENGSMTLYPETGYTFSEVNIRVNFPVWDGSYYQN